MPAGNRHITLYHAPQTRSTGVLILLEELQADYSLHVLNIKTGEQRQPAYLAVNPLGKVPAIRHGDAVITEQVAIFIYLADLYAEAGLAPAITDPLRGPYLRWLTFYAACFEPAITDRAQQRDPGPVASSPYGAYDTVIRALYDQLRAGSCLLGQRYTAADVLWGVALGWMLQFKVIPADAAVQGYVDRASARPAVQRAQARDAALAAAQG